MAAIVNISQHKEIARIVVAGTPVGLAQMTRGFIAGSAGDVIVDPFLRVAKATDAEFIRIRVISGSLYYDMGGTETTLASGVGEYVDETDGIFYVGWRTGDLRLILREAGTV